MVALKSRTVHGVFDHVVAVFICFAVGDAGPHAAAGHPGSEAARMMVAAIVLRSQAALAVNSAAKLAGPDDERVVQQTALFEIGDQRVAAAVSLLAKDRQRTGHVVVHVPAALVDLRKSHAAFSHPPGHQAVVGKGAGLFGVRAIEIPGRLWLLAQVGKFRAPTFACDTPSRTERCAHWFPDRPVLAKSAD